MRLYEFEGKDLLASAGIHTPKRFFITPLSELQAEKPTNLPCVLKGQVLHGNRAHQGLIALVKTQTEWQSTIQTWQTKFEPSTLILSEELVAIESEMYLTLRYDTRPRRPVLLFSAQGGTGIEGRGDSLQTHVLQFGQPLPSSLQNLHPKISAEWIAQLIQIFMKNDLTLLEINPLINTANGLMALDAKVELDDTAAFRHPEWEELYPPRTLFARKPTQREQQAKQVNSLDHRGVAGASYFEFEGTIGVLASGGGASQLAMDALLASGLTPANYTEYSGNPPREKVAALTQVVMSQPNLEGLWVIGGHANFTDIYETLMGVIDGVEAAKPKPGFPIIVRRGGPRQEEAFIAMRERGNQLGLNIQSFNSSFPITDTVGVLQTAVQEFRNTATQGAL